jgi:O-antigen/teichoic acid export membrane protein
MFLSAVQKEVVIMQKWLEIEFIFIFIASIPTAFYFYLAKYTSEYNIRHLRVAMVMTGVSPWLVVVGGFLGWLSGESPLLLVMFMAPVLSVFGFLSSFCGFFMKKQRWGLNALASVLCLAQLPFWLLLMGIDLSLLVRRLSR